MRLALLALSLNGALVFGVAFAATFAPPIVLERDATDFIRGKLGQCADELIDSIGEAGLKRAAVRLSDTYAKEAAQVERELEAQVPEQIAASIARMQDLSCACRDKLAGHLRKGFEVRLVTLEDFRAHLGSFLEASYAELVQGLLRDLRIFTGTTLASFLLLVAVAVIRARAAGHLMLPAVLLFAATCISSFLYVFNQNWLYSIAFNDYVGFGYLAYLVATFALLCDIALNHARITTKVINAALGAVGSAASIAPC